jgi:hypothetical protein
VDEIITPRLDAAADAKRSISRQNMDVMTPSITTRYLIALAITPSQI